MPIKYRLKPGAENFQVMSGPFEGRKFVRGKVYAEVPAGYQDCFEEIPPIPPLEKGGKSGAQPKPAKKKPAVRDAETPLTDAAETDKSDADFTDGTDLNP